MQIAITYLPHNSNYLSPEAENQSDMKILSVIQKWNSFWKYCFI